LRHSQTGVMGGDKVQINLRMSNIKNVNVKKRKAGADINTAIAEAVY